MAATTDCRLFRLDQETFRRILAKQMEASHEELMATLKQVTSTPRSGARSTRGTTHAGGERGRQVRRAAAHVRGARGRRGGGARPRRHPVPKVAPAALGTDDLDLVRILGAGTFGIRCSERSHSPVAEETEEEPAESGIKESNIENYLYNENENENMSDIIEHQEC